MYISSFECSIVYRSIASFKTQTSFIAWLKHSDLFKVLRDRGSWNYSQGVLPTWSTVDEFRKCCTCKACDLFPSQSKALVMVEGAVQSEHSSLAFPNLAAHHCVRSASQPHRGPSLHLELILPITCCMLTCHCFLSASILRKPHNTAYSWLIDNEKSPLPSLAIFTPLVIR